MFSSIIAVSLKTLEKFNFCLWTHTLQSPALQVLSIRMSCDWFLSLWFSHNEAGVRCSCSQCVSASFGFSRSPLCPLPNCPPRGLHTCLVLSGCLASSGFFLLFLPFSALPLLGIPEQKHPPHPILIPFVIPVAPFHLTQVQGLEQGRMLEVNWPNLLNLQMKLREPGWER